MMMHRAWAACALVLLLWPAAPAWADTRTDARRYFNRGMEAIQEGRTREGIDLLEQAYELRPHPNVLFNIARAYASLNEVDDAVRYFDKYLESNPPDRGPTDQVLAELRERQRLRRLVDDGMNAVASGRYIEGVALLARAYAERPHPNLLFNIGRAYESAGEFKQAVEAYQGYLESKPPDSAQVAEKVRVLEEKVRSQAARAGSPVASAPPTKTGGGGVALDEDGMRKLAAEIAGLLRDQGRGVGVGGGAPVGSVGSGVGTPVDVRVRGSTAALDEAGLNVAAKDGAAYEEVVVTASRREQSPLDAPNAVTIISEEDIRLSGARNIPDLLRRVPGMDVMAMTASDWNVSMRGFNRRVANKILVLIDGRSVYLDFLGATLWQTLALDVMDIERIEVVRGPGSAIYGAYAYTGIINIITKKPEAIDGSTLRLDVGSGQVARGTYQVGRREGKVGFRATAAFEQANKFEREFGDRVDFTTLATDPNLSFRAAYIDADVEYELPNGGRLHGGGSASFGKLEFYGVSVLRNQLIEMRPLANARVGYSGDLFSVLAFWQGTRVVSSPEYFRTGLASLGSNVIADLFSIEPVFRPTFTLLGEHQLVLGAEYRHKYISWDYLSGEQSEDHFALFAQDQWAINPRFTVLASARLDKHPLIGFLGSPRLALIFKPTPKSALRASVGTAFRQPTHGRDVPGAGCLLAGGGRGGAPGRRRQRPRARAYRDVRRGLSAAAGLGRARAGGLRQPHRQPHHAQRAAAHHHLHALRHRPQRLRGGAVLLPERPARVLRLRRRGRGPPVPGGRPRRGPELRVPVHRGSGHRRSLHRLAAAQGHAVGPVPRALRPGSGGLGAPGVRPGVGRAQLRPDRPVRLRHHAAAHRRLGGGGGPRGLSAVRRSAGAGHRGQQPGGHRRQPTPRAPLRQPGRGAGGRLHHGEVLSDAYPSTPEHTLGRRPGRGRAGLR
jgi:hypothetical protein